MRLYSRLVLLLSLFSMLRTSFGAMNCDEEGDIQFDPSDDGEVSNDKTYRLIQVCLLKTWTYVCQSEFSHYGVDKDVVLHQLQCSAGGTSRRVNSRELTPAYMQRIDCIGIEKKLIDCPRDGLKYNWRCQNKVQVYCENNTITRQCLNGDIYRNETDEILYICVNEEWKTLCPILWETAQATVACRHLYPNSTVIRAVTYTKPATAANTNGHFMYHFYCTGNEKKITDCRMSQVLDDILCSDENVTALKCDTESIMTRPTSVLTNAQSEGPVPWVAGIIIGAVLSTIILVTVIVAVYLWRKKTQSLYKMSDLDSSSERRTSLSHTNQCYSSTVQEPQEYEEFQPSGQDPQPAAADGVYSYADHTVNTNVYDSVPQSNESSECYGNSKTTAMPALNTVDNTALYSLCEQDTAGAYSQLNRK